MVYKVINIVGVSPDSWEGAIQNAIEETAKTVRGIGRVIVNAMDVKVENDKIVSYRVDVNIYFKVER
ncbi:MAG TPA: dodecin domain-containing protein [Candidatus Syntrophoarchaeum butanivorans]|uniref:Dodecin domain-containing protein n=1 Tax=Candidatus Syntropharchaeum butanivorans TaxID=1839936 RepID=A0A7C1B9I0_9EURY|nr:MAG: dodecin domain-containing protein [Candidatus Syntrophoarchaeum sp. WYZ-LMO15]HDM36661.1 dodecin domain-containing protein [Candidatus Syntrophoarchaeum butanivorans]HEC56513.1 dodecin domain-containing protein [Candidatus Syntrophoarchaeum butanivorans]